MKSGRDAASRARAGREGPHFGGVIALAAIVRTAAALVGARYFPPAGDGTYYDALARRLAEGQGYTWLWPDGAVTYAAHYPVGYPALIAALYAAVGPHPGAAMMLNAFLGTVTVAAIYDVLAATMSPRRAALGALAVALHPALVFYTPAIMTEAPTLAFLAVALACAVRARGAQLAGRAVAFQIGAGMAVGIATVIRPQSLAFAPVIGALGCATRAPWAVFRNAVIASALALACCAPWTARNCLRMQRCALVSVNGGWNALIGVQSTTGAFVPIDVPRECSRVWAEAAKDDCFGAVARARIVENPSAFVRAIPRKVAVTFDYFGAAPWYLHTSNSAAFGDNAKTALGAFETLVSRLLLVASLVGCARIDGPRKSARWAIAALGMLFACVVHGSPAYLLLALQIGLLGPQAWGEASPLLPWTAALIVLTAAIHGVFFGAGRYGLVAVPFIAALPFVPRRPCQEAVRMRTLPPSTPNRRSPARTRPRPSFEREESPSSKECDAG